jgi:tRNA(Ile)-lysidine synthase
VVCNIGHLRALNPALRRRVLRLAIKQLSGSLEGVSLCHIDAVGDLIDSARPNSRLSLPQQIVAMREYDSLIFSQVSAAKPDADFELQIIGPGCYQLPTGGYLAAEMVHSAKTAKTADSVCIDLAKIPLPWLVRTFRAGDRMTPFGMSGRKKVKDIFIDRKIPLSERRRIPLLCSGDDLIWIAGICASELSRIDGASEQALLITWHRS